MSDDGPASEPAPGDPANGDPARSDVDGELRLAGLRRLFALKRTKRTGWLRAGVEPHACESVAEHAFYVVTLAALCVEAGLDRGTVIDMALVHDWAEIYVGDLTPEDCPREEKIARERAAMSELCRALPQGERWLSIWEAYERQDSPEARFVRAVDRCEMDLQATLYAQAAGVDPTPFQEFAKQQAPFAHFKRLQDALQATLLALGAADVSNDVGR